MRLWLLTLLLTCSLSAQNLYKTPAQIIDGPTVTRLEQQMAAPNPDVAKIILDAEAELGRYNAQFISDKRIQDERRNQSEAMSENTVRLLALARGKLPGRSYFLGEHPYLFRIHSLLGKAYELAGDRPRALNQYSMAFRFTSLEQPYSEPADDASRTARYMEMRSSFADPDRIAEEPDMDSGVTAGSFRADLDSYVKLRLEVDEAEKQIAVEEAKLARGQPADPASARAKFAQKSQEKKTIEQRLEQVRKTTYKKFALEKQKRNGALAYAMALLVQQTEGKNKEIDRILNRSSFYRGIGNELGEDRTPYREFTGYGMLLEFANKIDPDNPLYVSLLANEYRRSRQVELALRYFELYFQLTDGTNQKPDDYSANILTLAGLFTDSQNYIRASDLLEKYIQNVDSPQVKLQLADIDFARTGKLDRAKTFYSEFLAVQTPLAQISDVKKRTETALVIYRVHRNLASISRRKLRSEEELSSLAAAEQIFRSVSTDYEAARKTEEDIRARLFEIKKKILGREDEDLQREYYRVQRIDLAEAAEATGYLRTRLDSMSFALVLERQAFLAERARDFNLAREKYSEMVLRGTGPEQTRARENLERIRLSLADGLLRPPALAPDFER